MENGLTFTVTSCDLAIGESTASAGTTACGSAGLAQTVVLEEKSTGRGPAVVEFLNTASGSILSLASGQTTKYDSLNLTFTVSGQTNAISSISNAVTGSSASNGSSCQLVGAASCLTYTGGASGSLNASPLNSPATSSFTATNNLSVSLMLGVGVPSGSGTLTLNTATLTFSPAPEPASIALLATGLAGIAAARRQSKRASAVKILA